MFIVNKNITKFNNIRGVHFSLEGTPYAKNLALTHRQQGQIKKASLSGPLKDFYVVGSCEQGQLGIGKLDDIEFTPKRIDLLEGVNISSLSVGHNHCTAVLADGSGVLSWGYNSHGQLGQGSLVNCPFPAPMIPLEGYRVLETVTGPLQTFIFTENVKTGKPALWHMGIAYADSRSDQRFTVNTTVPIKIKKKSVLGDAELLKVIPGADFCIWIDTNNIAYSFGTNGQHCALGQGEGEEISLPTPIRSLVNTKIVDAQVGWGHTIARTEDGRLFAWGSNQHGQCGLGMVSTGVSVPTEITALRGVNIVQISCGETHSLALDDQGHLYSWGSCAEGRLGYKSKEDESLPKRIEFFEGKPITKVSGGCDHSAAFTDNGDVYLWGFGQHGALSVNSQMNNSATPLLLPPPRFKTLSAEKPIVEYLKKIAKKTSNSKKTDTIGESDGTIPIEPPNFGFKKSDPGYPFLDKNNKKISEGAFFDKHYSHKITDVFCGMDFTVLEVTSTIKEQEEKIEKIGKKNGKKVKKTIKE